MNMKKIITTIGLLSLAVGAFAQESSKLSEKQFKVIEPSSFSCLYLYSVEGINHKNEEFCDEFHTILQGGASCAKFWDYGAFKADSTAYLSESSNDDIVTAQNQLSIQKFYFDSEIFQNMPKGKITENGIIGIDYYVYSEPKSKIKWTLHTDTLTVMKTLCNKATTEFGGRVWTAWYAPSIPVSYGPWKLSGLPGLILKAEEDSGMHTFEAYSLRQNTLPIYNDTAKQRIKISKARFLKAKVIQEYDPADIPIETIQTVSVRKDLETPLLLFNNIPLRLHPNGYHSLEPVKLKTSEIPEPRYELQIK